MDDFISQHKTILMVVLGVLAGITLMGSVAFVLWSRSRRKAREAGAVPGAPLHAAPGQPLAPGQIPVRGAAHHWTRNAAIVSMALHTAFLVSTVFIVTWRARAKEESTFKSAPPPRPKLQPRQMEMKVKAQNLQKASGRPRLMPRLVAMTPGQISLPVIQQTPNATKQAVKRDYAAFGTSGFGYGIGGGDGTGFGGGTGGGLPNLMSARCSEVDRRRRLEAAGGTPACEEAVIRGLNFLKAKQNTDGSWGQDFAPAMTGLALLAYLGHCETTASKDYGPAVAKAIRYLERLGRKGDGYFWADTQGKTSAVYQNAIAIYALAEAYTMSHDRSLAPLLKEAVKNVLEGQGAQGGWFYRYEKGHIDSSVTAWHIQALKAVHLTGLRISGVEEGLNRGVAAMKGMQSGQDFRYQDTATHNQSPNGRAGLGTLCLQFWKQGKTAEAQRGLDGIMQILNTVDYHGGAANLYGWYYNTLACYQAGGDYWKRWNGAFQKTIVSSQSADGSWPAEGKGLSASWAKADAPFYRTALCVLMLESYYRYLPTTEGGG